jgi:hypothetical protein
MLTPGRLLAHAAAAVSGAVAGLAGSFVHSFTSYGVPFGLVIAITMSSSVFAIARVVTSGRSGAGVAVAGWLVPVVLLSSPRAEGDLVIAATRLGYAWLMCGASVAAIALAWPRHPGDSRRAGLSSAAGPSQPF